YYKTGSSPGAPIPSRLKIRRDSRLARPGVFRPKELSAIAAYDDVLDDVGANAGVTCRGDWVSRPDAADTRVINDVRTGRGPGAPVRAGRYSYPSLRTGSGCVDSDADGLPNDWESRYPSSAQPHLDQDGDGYLSIEEYVNGTNPTVRN